MHVAELENKINDLESKIEELQNVNEFLFSKLKIGNEYSNFKKKNEFTKSFCDFVQKETRRSLYFKSNDFQNLSVEFYKNEETEIIESIFIKNTNKMFTFSYTRSTNKYLYYFCEEEHNEDYYCYHLYIKQDNNGSYVAEYNGENYYLNA